MDEKLKTQTFRFTNQFKGVDDEESLEVSNNLGNMGPIESDEDSIEEEIEISEHSH